MLHAKFTRGFTLIEMMVVFAIMGTLTIAGVNSFFSYSQAQSFQSAVSGVSHSLNDIRTRSISQVIPSKCGTKPLRYYQLNVIAPGSTYKINAMCDTTLTNLDIRTLPTGVTFTDAAPININFVVASGVPMQSQTVTIAGFGKTSKITVDATGIVSVQ